MAQTRTDQHIDQERSTATSGPSVSHAGRSPIQYAAGIVGVVFLLVGIAGFVPGITQNVGDITVAGPESEAQLLGLFEVNILHNLVHVAFGLVGLAAARAAGFARSYFIIGGVAYLALWLYGLFVDLDSDANFASLNTADNWLHLGLGAGMLLLSLLPGHRRKTVDVR